jgi:hypothetical protein
MTFEEARVKLVDKLKARFDRLVTMLQDPALQNTMWPKLQDQLDSIKTGAYDMVRLNNTISAVSN